MLKKLLTLLLVLLQIGVNRLHAQIITSPGSSGTISTAYTNGTPNDNIYMFCTPNAAGTAVTGSLSATMGVPNCTFTWVIFDPVSNTYNPFTVQSGLTTSTLSGLASGGYHVTIKNGAGTVIGCDLAWIWVNQTVATVAAIPAGCSPFSLSGTSSAVSNFTYYNPPPEPFLVSAATTINVCFSGTHTYDSDLGFFLVGPATCGSPTVTLSPNPGANGEGSVCNSGDNINNLCFTTAASPNFDPCVAATPYTGTYDSYGPAGTPTNINWTGIYGCDATEGGWSVQIFDCIGADVGALTGASISFSGNSGCGVSNINYNSGAINSAINDNSCTSATASIFTVPSNASVPVALIGGNSVTFQWTASPAYAIPNATTSLTPSINPCPTVDTWFYLTVTDNRGCVKKDSAFFDYSPSTVPVITPAGLFCANGAATTLTANVGGGTWSGNGITNAATGAFNPALATVGSNTITYTTPGACGSSTTATITVNAVPTATVPASATYCAGALIPATTFATVPAGGTFAWTNSNTSIGLGANGTGNIAAFNAVNAGATTITGTIAVTPTVNGCVGPASNYTITVKPLPTLSAVASQTVCANAATTAVTYVSNPAGATVNWTNSNAAIGIAASGTGNIASFTATNAGSTVISGNFSATSVLAGCTGPATTFTITVNPLPTLTAVASQTVCANAATTGINFVSNPVGATVNWTNSNATIGLATSGTGNIGSFTATNATAAAISGNFSATPTLTGCIGTPTTFTITVNPLPTLTAVPNQIICETTNSTAITFVSNPAGATVNWTNNNTAIGLGASASGNIPVFTGTNGTASPITGNLVATPTLAGCIGPVINFDITVSSAPTLTAIPSQTVCATTSTAAITFVSNPIGATINWTNSNGSIGVATSGIGDIAAFTGTNGTAAGIFGNFVATPSIGTCIGPPQTFTITVNPMPVLSAVPSQTVCAGASTAAIAYSVNPAAATVNWTNSDNTIGVGATGSGNIAAFTGVNAGVVPLTGNFVATPSILGCTGVSQAFSITINPMPSIPAVSSQTLCAGSSTTAIIFGQIPATATVDWTNDNASIGLAATGTGDIASFIGINAGSTAAIGNFTATPSLNGCVGTAQTFTITVNPMPVLTVVPSQTVCAGASTAAITYSVNPAAAAVNWSNSDNTIGVGPTGTGNIAVFTGTNAGTAPITGNFVATPSILGCTGAQQAFSITINPMPSIPPVSSQTVCTGLSTTTITFNPVPGTSTVNWTNDNTAIGTVASGTGDINPFTVSNATTSAISGNFTATPSLNGCIGTAQTFTITVNPGVVVNPILPVTVCNTVNVPISIFASTPTGATFGWTNTNTSIGLGGSGTGNTPSFVASNVTSNPVTSVVGVIATLNGCISPVLNYIITVNPTPPPPGVSPVTYCMNDPAVALTATGTNLVWYTSPGLANPQPSVTPGTAAADIGVTNYYVTQTILTCISPPAQLAVTVNPLPVITAPANSTACSGAAVAAENFTSTPSGATLVWANSNAAIGLAVSGTGNVPGFAGTNTSTTGPINGTVTVIPTLTGCVGSAITYTVTINPLPTVAVNNVTACNTATVAGTNWVSVPAGSSFAWTNSNTSINLAASGVGDITSFTATNSTTSAATAFITVTPTLNTCTGPSSNYTIVVNPTPGLPTTTNVVYCEGNTAVPLIGTPSAGGVLNWYGTNATGGASSGAAPTPSTGSAVTTIYYVSQTINNCEGPRAPLSVLVNPLPVAALSPQVSGCAPLYKVFTVSSVPAGVTYDWSLGNGLFSGNDTVPLHCYSTPGIYNIAVTVTDINNCTATTPFNNWVTVFALPIADFSFSPQPTTIFDPEISFINYSTGGPISSSNWSFGDSLMSSSVLFSPSYTYLYPGTFSVQLIVVNANGCRDTSVQNVTIDDDLAVYVPNAFSPNGDLLNDTFSPKGNGIDPKHYQLWVFDRWGNEVFYTDDVTKQWEGKVHGEGDIVQQDVYVWKLKVRSTIGNSKQLVGHVTVIK